MKRKFVSFDDSNDNVTKYFKEVRKSVLISPEREIELAKKIKNGDANAVNELVGANLKFVISIAKDYQGQGLSFCDLISEGNYGLIKAASKFDHTRGFRFTSYAIWWIKQAILQSLSDNSRIVRLPINVIQKLSHLKKEIEKFEFANEREPVFGDILDVNNENLELILHPKSLSLNSSVNEEGDEMIEFLISDNLDVSEIDTIVLDQKIKLEIEKTLGILEPRERDIIESYFGINRDIEPMTLEAIGDKYGISKERVRQLKEKILRKLRYNAHGLYSVINE